MTKCKEAEDYQRGLETEAWSCDPTLTMTQALDAGGLGNCMQRQEGKFEDQEAFLKSHLSGKTQHAAWQQEWDQQTQPDRPPYSPVLYSYPDLCSSHIYSRNLVLITFCTQIVSTDKHMTVNNTRPCDKSTRLQCTSRKIIKEENFTTRLTWETWLTVKTAVIKELEFIKCDIIVIRRHFLDAKISMRNDDRHNLNILKFLLSWQSNMIACVIPDFYL